MGHDDNVKSRFNEWAVTGRGHSMAKEHSLFVDSIYDAWDLKSNAYLLDVGCGIGSALLEARNRGVMHLFGIDASDEMINVAKKKIPEAAFRTGLIQNLPWDDESFTHVISIECLYYLKNPKEALSEILRVLKPDGKFATAIEYYLENTGSHGWKQTVPEIMTNWSEEEWKQALVDVGFKNVETSRIKRNTKNTNQRRI